MGVPFVHVAWSQNNFKGLKWIFDEGMLDNEQVFKETIKRVLKTDGATRQKLLEHLRLNSLKSLYDWLEGVEGVSEGLFDKLDDFFEVLN